MADTLGVENPFRYRGYVYDEETGLYYLRNRYYDPEWGRFLNADILLGSIGATFTHNAFVYCKNAAATKVDMDGYTGVAIGAAAASGPAGWLLLGVFFLGCLLLAQPAPVPRAATIPKEQPETMGKILPGPGFGREERPEPMPGPRPTPATTPRPPILFPQNPMDFNPKGCLARPFPRSDNGAIIKWFDSTGTPVFEWNEDFAYGPHYHVLSGPKGVHTGDHRLPGTPVPEPEATIYFR